MINEKEFDIPLKDKHIKNMFESPDLILNIHKELSDTHIGDDAAKMTAFIVCSTSYQKQPERRMSMANKAGTSEGKDNLIKTTLRHFPDHDYLFLTHGTQATMQDDIGQYKIIAYSEVNLQRDDKGANFQLLETIKQMTEGGTAALKKDKATGCKTTKHIIQEQKTVLYSTTETQDDEEMATRFIIGSLSSSRHKINTVNNNTLSTFAGKKIIFNESWIKKGISYFLKDNEVNIPYLIALQNKGIFDDSVPRSMRDTKRFLSCVCGVAWLYQLQRQKDSEGRIIAEPFDFLVTMIIAGDFFNHTYRGMGDQRLQKFIDAMNEYCDARLGDERDIFPRHKIQEKLGVTVNTIRNLSKGCDNLSIIRFHHKENSKIYYERCQKGIKRVLMGVNYEEMIKVFEGIEGIKIPEKTLKILQELHSFINKDSKSYTSESLPEEIDTLKIDTPPIQKTENGSEPLIVTEEEVKDE